MITVSSCPVFSHPLHQATSLPVIPLLMLSDFFICDPFNRSTLQAYRPGVFIGAYWFTDGYKIEENCSFSSTSSNIQWFPRGICSPISMTCSLVWLLMTESCEAPVQQPQLLWVYGFSGFFIPGGLNFPALSLASTSYISSSCNL